MSCTREGLDPYPFWVGQSHPRREEELLVPYPERDASRSPAPFLWLPFSLGSLPAPQPRGHAAAAPPQREACLPGPREAPGPALLAQKGLGGPSFFSSKAREAPGTPEPESPGLSGEPRAPEPRPRELRRPGKGERRRGASRRRVPPPPHAAAGPGRPGRGLGRLSQWVPQEESGRREIVRDVSLRSRAAAPEATLCAGAESARAGRLRARRVRAPATSAARSPRARPAPGRSGTHAARPPGARRGRRPEGPGPGERAAHLLAGIHGRAVWRRRLRVQRARGRAGGRAAQVPRLRRRV